MTESNGESSGRVGRLKKLFIKEKDPNKVSFMDKQRAARPWLDHLLNAATHYTGKRGDFYAAGATYFTVLALFPVIMVAFAIAGYVLINQPDTLADIQHRIADKAQGSMGKQLNDLIDNAIKQRAAVGVIGLLGALYAGLGFINNIRAALTEQWGDAVVKESFIKTKLSDLGAMVTLGVGFIISFGLSALAGSSLVTKLLESIGADDIPGIDWVIRVFSIVISLAASTILFTLIIARMPRKPRPLKYALKAGLLTAVFFEVFKIVATFYLKAVLSGPAGATFGPILGIMVFAFITYRIVLFATAWAATDPINAKFIAAQVPEPVTIRPRIVVNEGASPRGLAAAVGAGLAAALGVTALRNRRK